MNWRRGIVLKSKRELNLMRKAGLINARALAAAVEAVKPGVTTDTINQAAAKVLEKYGAKPAFVGVPGAYPYPAETTISINNELVHGIPSDRRLKQGDIISIDCGTVYEGFVGDSALTIGVGEISPDAEHLLQVTRESLFIGIEKMVAGNRSGDVSAAIQAHVEKNGLEVVREYTG
ncbi:MAG: M24 family metallopeptidase, partial [Anaerolineales bacterium]